MTVFAAGCAGLDAIGDLAKLASHGGMHSGGDPNDLALGGPGSLAGAGYGPSGMGAMGAGAGSVPTLGAALRGMGADPQALALQIQQLQQQIQRQTVLVEAYQKALQQAGVQVPALSATQQQELAIRQLQLQSLSLTVILKTQLQAFQQAGIAVPNVPENTTAPAATTAMVPDAPAAKTSGVPAKQDGGTTTLGDSVSGFSIQND